MSGRNLIFAPVSPEGRPICEALEAYEIGRPTQNIEFQQQVNLGIFITACILWSITLIFMYIYREEPRLRAVRPFAVNFIFVVAQILFAIGISLNKATDDLPCGLLLYSLLIAVAGFGANYVLRAALYSVETQFAQKITKTYKQASFKQPKNELEEEHLLTQQLLENKIKSSWFYAFILVLKLALGLISIDDVEVHHLAMVKRSIWQVIFVFYAPALICSTAIIASIPTYQHCRGCSIFLEITVSLAVLASFNVLVGLRILYVCYQGNFPDSQGVFQESTWVVLTVVPIVLISGILIMIDPNNVEYNRNFQFEWILDAGMLIYWWFVAGKQFLEIYRSRRQIRHAQSFSSMDFIKLMEEDEETRFEFEAYAERHYAVESLHFVFDVASFRRFFEEKGTSWRIQKARLLLETYVRPGSVMEVNVSYDTRKQIIDQAEKAINGDANARSLKELFDPAVDDLVVNVLRSMWTSFLALNPTFVRHQRGTVHFRGVGNSSSVVGTFFQLSSDRA